MKLLKKIDKNLERWVMFLLLAGMTLVLGIRGGKLGIVLPSFHNLYQNISQNSVSLRF